MSTKRKKKPDMGFLEFHMYAMMAGEKLPDCIGAWGKYKGGLCHIADSNFIPKLPKQILPKWYDSVRDTHFAYWGSGSTRSGKCGVYTPLRQTLILFAAALKNEL